MKNLAEGAALDTRESAGGAANHTGLDRLLYWRYYPKALHVPLYGALAILIYFAFNPHRQAEGNLTTELVWKLWWPGLPFILLLGGRIWCGVCPFGGISDLGLKINKGKKKAAPSLIRRFGPWLGAFSVFGFGMAFLALGLEENAGATGIILIVMAALAFGFSVLFKGRTFCRYFCPVGMITRVYSFFSWIRPRGGGAHAAVTCPVGQSPAGLRQPSQCQLCGGCTGPGVSGIKTSFTAGSGRIPGHQEFGRPEAALSLLLLGLMAADSVRMTSLFARFQQFALPFFNYNYRLSVFAGVSALVAAVLALQLLGSWLSSRRTRQKSVFAGIAFSYLPFSLGVFLSLAMQHLWSGLWPVWQTVLAESRLIKWTGHMPPANVYFTSLPLKSIQFVLLGTGLYLSWRISRKEFAVKGTGDDAAGAIVAARRMMVVSAASGFGFLFLLPMSGAC